MITVEEADKIIFDDIKVLPAIRIPLQESYGKVLREDLLADRDLPPFNRATMDGIAVQLSSWERGNRIYSIEGVQKAGSPSLTLKNNDACIEVMTGAVVPIGCDCVIPVEHIKTHHGKAEVQDDFKLSSMMSIHAQGSDYQRGEKLVQSGCRLFPPQVAVAASIGKSKLLVSQTPKIAVIGTGDELVDVDRRPEPYQIRQSNAYALQSALQLQGCEQANLFHINDNKDELKTRLKDILENYDVLILSGGVSMGKFDYVPEALTAIGVKVFFHKVKQRPGKPFWFGKNSTGKPVFALPGNPVSTQMGAYRYILPYIRLTMGERLPSAEFAILNEDVQVPTDLTLFLPVLINGVQDGRLSVNPVFPNGSGDFASLASADGFVELPSDTFQFPKGTAARFYRWKL